MNLRTRNPSPLDQEFGEVAKDLHRNIFYIHSQRPDFYKNSAYIYIYISRQTDPWNPSIIINF